MNDNKLTIISGKYQQGNIQYGMKWKLFYFGCLLKSARPARYGTNFAFFVIFLFVTCYTSLYPIFTELFQPKTDDCESIFPYSYSLTMITPTLFPMQTIIFTVAVFFVVFITLFLIAYEKSKLILSTWWLFLPHVHLIFYPFVCGVIGFCISHIAHAIGTTNGGVIFAIHCVNIILFFVYTFILNILVTIETHSIIGPNPLFSHYFTSMPIVYPYFLAIISALSYRITDFSEINQIIILVLLTIVCALIGLFILIDKIYMNALVNEVESVHFFFMAFAYIFAIIAIKTHSRSDLIVISVPVLTILSFILVHYSVKKYRSKTEKMLMQIGDPSTLTVESLSTTFELIKSERRFRTIIKVGLSSGKDIVMNETFVRFVLEKFPNSEWMLKYVVFLYSCVWGCNSDTYQFLLHLLSIDTLFYTTQMLLFETIFCYMQASQTMSPIISRQLEDYRITFLSLCRAHKKFWSSGITKHEFDDAQSGILQLFQQTMNELTRLYKYYRFCPSIVFERSIFESDFKHKYDKSAKYFQKGNSLSKDPKKYISDELFKRFVSFFPGLRPETTIQKVHHHKETSMTSDGFVFLSSREQNERAIYYSSQLITYDNYIEKLCKPFFIQKTQLQNEYQFFNSNIILFACIFIYVITQFIICFALIRVTNDLMDEGKVVYNSALSDIRSTLDFRKDIAVFRSNILLIVDIERKTFGNDYTFPYSGNPIDMKQFRLFSLRYLQETEQKLMKYKYKFDHFNSTYPIHDIEHFDFSNAFSKMHVMYDALAPTVESNQQKEIMEIYLLLFPILVNSTIKNLTELSEQIYFDIVDYLQDYSNNIFNSHASVFIGLIVVGILAPLIVFIIESVSLNALYSKVSSIIKTIQPPILKYISDTFKKLLAIEEHQVKEKQWYNFVNPSKILVPTFVCLLIHPLLLLLFIFLSNRTVYYNKSLIGTPDVSNLTRFIYFNRAMLEFGFQDSLANYGIEVAENYSFTLNSIYDVLDNDFDVKCKFFDYPKDVFYGVTLILYCFAIPLFVYYLHLFYMTHQVSMSSRYMLYFLPQVAVNSNPVFQALIRGYHLSNKEVNKFAHDLSKVPEFKGMFCTYFYNSNNEISETYGDSKMFLPFQPYNLSEISQFFETRNGYNPSVNIHDFFENKQPNSTLKLISNNNKDLSITFIPPDQLFIRLELANEETIKKEKLTRYISSINDDFIPKKRPPIQNGYIFIITQLEQSQHAQLIEMAKDQPFFFFDTRNLSIFCAMDIYQTDSAHICLNYLKNLPETCCAAIADGGPMTFFDMPRGTISKSRCIAEPYDVAFHLLNIAKPGMLYFTKSFLDRLIPKNSQQLPFTNFNSVPTSNKNKILFATIEFACIQELVENTEVKKEEPPVAKAPGLQGVGSGMKMPRMMNPSGFPRGKRFGP